ncbi:TetR/AcrR family transcriptional regulator [Dokdonella immobilis]|uniref:Transcriptional regulator, TetR family n=1 Tax=Dokdonella immobilis TaxID=578942 RepID=A0A1I4XQM1_9GAMM|nr:TetR/AcrR family transcriptional regulator [Dokdonella immobilis]SFN27976.1 transcriptional regulator, TetR family [Dokdonella immobilis]
MKLSRGDWLAHGMDVLAKEGFDALKADLLAKSLGVSRGSFYWHFKDIRAFHAALIEEWHQRATQQVIDWLEQGAEESRRLNALVQRAWTVSSRTERAVRAWATHNPEIASRIEAVDTQRIGYIADLLESAGLTPKQARARALFIASAYLGRIVLGDSRSAGLPAKELETIVELLQSGA